MYTLKLISQRPQLHLLHDHSSTTPNQKRILQPHGTKLRRTLFPDSCELTTGLAQQLKLYLTKSKTKSS